LQRIMWPFIVASMINLTHSVASRRVNAPIKHFHQET